MRILILSLFLFSTFKLYALPVCPNTFNQSIPKIDRDIQGIVDAHSCEEINKSAKADSEPDFDSDLFGDEDSSLKSRPDIINDKCECVLKKLPPAEYQTEKEKNRSEYQQKFGEFVRSAFLSHSRTLEYTAEHLALQGESPNEMAELAVGCNPRRIEDIQCGTQKMRDDRSKALFGMSVKDFITDLRDERDDVLGTSEDESKMNCLSFLEKENIKLNNLLMKSRGNSLKDLASIIAGDEQFAKIKGSPLERLKNLKDGDLTGKYSDVYELVSAHPLLKSLFQSNEGYANLKKNFIREGFDNPMEYLKFLFEDRELREGVKNRIADSCHSFYGNIKKLLCKDMDDYAVSDFNYNQHLLEVDVPEGNEDFKEALYCQALMCSDDKRKAEADGYCVEKREGSLDIDRVFSSMNKDLSDGYLDPLSEVRLWMKGDGIGFDSAICPYLVCADPDESGKTCEMIDPRRNAEEAYKLAGCPKDEPVCDYLKGLMFYQNESEARGLVEEVEEEVVDEETGETRRVRVRRRASAFSRVLWAAKPSEEVKKVEMKVAGKKRERLENRRARLGENVAAGGSASEHKVTDMEKPDPNANMPQFPFQGFVEAAKKYFQDWTNYFTKKDEIERERLANMESQSESEKSDVPKEKKVRRKKFPKVGREFEDAGTPTIEDAYVKAAEQDAKKRDIETKKGSYSFTPPTNSASSEPETFFPVHDNAPKVDSVFPVAEEEKKVAAAAEEEDSKGKGKKGASRGPASKSGSFFGSITMSASDAKELIEGGKGILEVEVPSEMEEINLEDLLKKKEVQLRRGEPFIVYEKVDKKKVSVLMKPVFDKDGVFQNTYIFVKTADNGELIKRIKRTSLFRGEIRRSGEIEELMKSVSN